MATPKYGPAFVLNLFQNAIDPVAAGEIRPQGGHPYLEKDNALWIITHDRYGLPVERRLSWFTARILVDIREFDGQAERRFYEISCATEAVTREITLSLEEFETPGWPRKYLGHHAVVEPQQWPHVVNAICLLSQSQYAVRYCHVGWIELNGEWVYLHSGGGIGAKGHQSGIAMSLGAALADIQLELAKTPNECVEAVRSMLRILGISNKKRIGHILLATALRAVMLRPANFSVHVQGDKENFKSAATGVVQAFFGSRFDGIHFPAMWRDTTYSILESLFLFKNCLCTVDDLKLPNSKRQKDEIEIKADTVFRAQGNLEGRGRLDRNLGQRAKRPPRGILLSSGEDYAPAGSADSRTLTIDIAKADIDRKELTELQAAGAGAVLSIGMGEYLKWLAGDFDRRTLTFEDRVKELRAGHSGRLAWSLPELQAAEELFLEFAVEIAAIDAARRQGLITECQNALAEAEAAMAADRAGSDPATRFLRLVGAGIIAGLAHLVNDAAQAPQNAEALGWRMEGKEMRARGLQVGLLDSDDVWLHEEAALTVARQMAAGSGEAFEISVRALRKSLHNQGKLKTTSFPARTTYTVRKRIAGIERDCLHVRLDDLFGGSAAGGTGTGGSNTGSTGAGAKGGGYHPPQPPP
jgi:hypothetical protein